MKLPKLKYWYHATTLDRANQIIFDGYIKPGWIDGIYLANTENYASGFVRMRGNSKWAVFKIPRKRLNVKSLTISDDHNPSFFPEDLICARYSEPQIDITEDDVECWEIA